MSSLRNERKMSFNLHLPERSTTGINILFHNVRSLRAHFPIVNSSLVYQNSDIVILCETWLNAFDISHNFEISNFNLHRFDHPIGSTRQHAGSVVYIRNSLSALSVRSQFIGEGLSTQLVQIELSDQ